MSKLFPPLSTPLQHFSTRGLAYYRKRNTINGSFSIRAGKVPVRISPKLSMRPSGASRKPREDSWRSNIDGKPLHERQRRKSERRLELRQEAQKVLEVTPE